MTQKRLRADSQKTRDALLDVMGRLLVERGQDFSLPDLARESGLSTATVYRHFSDLGGLRQEFYQRYLGSLIQGLADLPGQYRGEELLRATCQTWVERTMPAARAATLIRSSEGYLERAQSDDPFVRRLHDEVLTPTLDQLIADHVIPDQDRDYAALIWITLFDERVLVDLGVAKGWTVDRIAEELRRTLISALHAAAPPFVPDGGDAAASRAPAESYVVARNGVPVADLVPRTGWGFAPVRD